MQIKDLLLCISHPSVPAFQVQINESQGKQKLSLGMLASCLDLVQFSAVPHPFWLCSNANVEKEMKGDLNNWKLTILAGDQTLQSAPKILINQHNLNLKNPEHS